MKEIIKFFSKNCFKFDLITVVQKLKRKLENSRHFISILKKYEEKMLSDYSLNITIKRSEKRLVNYSIIVSLNIGNKNTLTSNRLSSLSIDTNMHWFI